MPEKNSTLGKASFIISIASGIFLLLTVVIAGLVESSAGGMDEESGEAFMIGCSMLLLLIAEIVALGLGIGGMCMKNRRKVLAILGTCFSGATILGTMLLMLVGLSMS